MFKKRMLSLILATTLLMSSLSGVFAAESDESSVSQNIQDSQTLPAAPKDVNAIEAFSGIELTSIDENPTSGTLESQNISWEFTNKGMLTLTGTGAMDDFSPGAAPWSPQEQYIKFIYISDGITSIGDNAFYGLSNARSLYIPNGITSIGEGAFENCGELKEIVLPDSLLTIENGAFRECSKLKDITIPAGVTSIGNSCFAGCEKLKEINVESGNAKYVSDDGVLFNKNKTVLLAYPGHNKNQKYSIPNGVTEIAEYAFDACYNLTKISFPDTLLKISKGAFNDCDGIETVTIPASVTEIAQDAFMYGMESLEAINVDDGNANYSSDNGVLYDKNKTTLLRVPDAFETADDKYTLPNSVTTIGQEAFFECQTIEKLYIPNSVKKIEMAAFMYFDSLSYIKYYGTKTEWELIEKENFNELLDEVEIEFLNSEFSTSFPLDVGETCSITEVVDFGGNASIENNVSYSSSNTSVATIEGDTLVAVSEGETIVTATLSKNGEITAISAKVVVSPQGSDNKTKSFSLVEGETWSVTENFDFTATDLKRLEKVIWATTDPNVVTIDENYVITAVGEGQATILATYYGIVKYRVRVNITVKPKYTPAEYFQFSNGVITKYKGPDAVVKIPDKIGDVAVTAIGDYAFSGCGHVTKVTLPSTVKSIGYMAFRYCYNLSNINLNEGITTIGSYAFYYCSSLLKLTIPSTVNVTSCYSLFTGCSKLDTVIFAEGITRTGSILRGSNVRKVVLPSTLTEISNSAFASCYRLEKINIPAKVTTIGTSAFDYCRGLRQVNIASGSKLTYIGNYAFYDCSFATINLPEGLTSIGYGAFAYSELSTINIPNSVTTLGTSAFSSCYNLSDVTLGNKLTSIGYNTFYYCSSLTNIVIPNSVTLIDDYAFYNSGLKTITLGTGVKTIDYYAFAYCYNLTSIAIPDSVTYIGRNAFYNCSNLASISFGTGLKTICDYAFAYCRNLTGVDLPDGVTSIGRYMFQGCSKLTSLDLGNSITYIPDYTFYGCSALTKVTIPGSVRNLGYNIFASCRNITDVTLGEGITSIPSYTFEYCYNLKKITLPDSVKTIGYCAFYNCYNLEEINLGSGLTSIGNYAFEYCSKLKSIKIPDNVTSIGYGAFYYCTSLSSVTLNSKLYTINNYAFYSCKSLTSIDIPASVTSIGSYAFAYSSSLRNVTIGNGAAYIGYNAFYGCPWNPHAVLTRASYTTEENTGMSYIPLKVEYEFKEGSTATNKQVKITLPAYTFLVSGSMKFNGKTYTNYTEALGNGTYGNKTITIPVDNNKGEIKFCIKSSEYQTISTNATISYYTPTTGTKTDTIGSLNCKLPVISVSAPDVTGSANVTVSGLTIPNKTVTLYIDGVNKGTVYSNATGTFTKSITISNPENYRLYTIKAEVTNNGTIESAETDIQYVANTPTLKGLKLYYQGAFSPYGYSYGKRNEVYDLYNSNYKYIQWGYSGSYAWSAEYYKYYFTVDVSNRSQVEKVYVVSTRDGHKEYLEAKWDSKLGLYKTSGYFANDWSYIPNNITVEYTKVIDDVKLSLADMLKYMNFGSGSFLPSITDYTSTSYSASVTVSPLLASLFGDRIDIATEITDVDYSQVTDETLYPDRDDYYSFPVTQNGKNCVVSFDLTDSTTAVIYIHDKSANKQIAYTMTFTDIDNDGNETKLDVNSIFDKIDSYAGRFMNLYNLNIDTEAIIQGLSKSALEESQLLELIKKAQNLDIKKKMFLLTSMVISAANMNKISAPTEIIEYIKALINSDIKFFGDLKLAITYRIGNEYKIRWKIDPSGYVYEGVTDNRLEGVTTTLFCIENSNIPKNGDGSYNFDAIDPSNISQWDAEEWDQVNPLVTDSNGTYRWDVPDDHHWQVKYTMNGYETAYSEWLPVPPVQENVNVGLVSNAVPTVEEVYITPEFAVINFSKYMDPDTVTNVTIGDLDYTLEYDTTKTDLDGNNFAKEFVFKFASAVTEGSSYAVSVSGAKSYAGVAMESYSATANVSAENVFSLTNVSTNNNTISVEYLNNTSKTQNFNSICAIYDANNVLIDMKSFKVEDLLTADSVDHDFTFEDTWNSYKIFTWDIELLAKPIIKTFDSTKNAG